MPIYYIGVDYVDGALLLVALDRLVGYKMYRVDVSLPSEGCFFNPSSKTLADIVIIAPPW